MVKKGSIRAGISKTLKQVEIFEPPFDDVYSRYNSGYNKIAVMKTFL